MPCKWFAVCPLRRFEKQGKITNRWRKEYCESEKNWMNCVRYQLEEKGEPHPDNMLPNGKIDEKLEE